MMDENTNDKNDAAAKNKVLAIAKVALLILIVAGIPLYIYFFHKDILSNFNSFESTVAFLRSYKQLSVPVYLLAEMLQIAISVLPGQLFQFAAGYLFGFLPGLFYTFIGAIIGTTVTFYLARFLGTDAVKLMLGEEKSKYYTERLNSRKAYLITFIIYLIPGFPKDLVCYVAGVSEMKFPPFLMISVAGRMPAMAASIAFGAMYMKHNYAGMVIVGVCVAIIFAACILKRGEIEKRFLSKYEDIK